VVPYPGTPRNAGSKSSVTNRLWTQVPGSFIPPSTCQTNPSTGPNAAFH